jgi:hypothetical protein
MTYASTSIDRRADYYARCAEIIAADPLDFYTRAERGRRFIANHLNPHVALPAYSMPTPEEVVAWRHESKMKLVPKDAIAA